MVSNSRNTRKNKRTSRDQLKKLQAKYASGGREWEALLDGRFGHDVKAHSALREWLYERKRQAPSLRASQLAQEIAEKFDVELSIGHINHLLRKRSLTAPPGRPFKRQEEAAAEQAALEAGTRLVEKHWWQHVGDVGVFKIYVRLWWDNDWGYSVRSVGCSSNHAGFSSRDEAEEAARERASEKIEELRQMRDSAREEMDD